MYFERESKFRTHYEDEDSTVIAKFSVRSATVAFLSYFWGRRDLPSLDIFSCKSSSNLCSGSEWDDDKNKPNFIESASKPQIEKFLLVEDTWESECIKRKGSGFEGYFYFLSFGILGRFLDTVQKTIIAAFSSDIPVAAVCSRQQIYFFSLIKDLIGCFLKKFAGQCRRIFRNECFIRISADYRKRVANKQKKVSCSHSMCWAAGLKGEMLFVEGVAGELGIPCTASPVTHRCDSKPGVVITCFFATNRRGELTNSSIYSFKSERDANLQSCKLLNKQRAIMQGAALSLSSATDCELVAKSYAVIARENYFSEFKECWVKNLYNYTRESNLEESRRCAATVDKDKEAEMKEKCKNAGTKKSNNTESSKFLSGNYGRSVKFVAMDVGGLTSRILVLALSDNTIQIWQQFRDFEEGFWGEWRIRETDKMEWSTIWLGISPPPYGNFACILTSYYIGIVELRGGCGSGGGLCLHGTAFTWAKAIAATWVSPYEVAVLVSTGYVKFYNLNEEGRAWSFGKEVKLFNYLINSEFADLKYNSCTNRLYVYDGIDKLVCAEQCSSPREATCTTCWNQTEKIKVYPLIFYCNNKTEWRGRFSEFALDATNGGCYIALIYRNNNFVWVFHHGNPKLNKEGMHARVTLVTRFHGASSGMIPVGIKFAPAVDGGSSTGSLEIDNDNKRHHSMLAVCWGERRILSSGEALICPVECSVYVIKSPLRVLNEDFFAKLSHSDQHKPNMLTPHAFVRENNHLNEVDEMPAFRPLFTTSHTNCHFDRKSSPFEGTRDLEKTPLWSKWPHETRQGCSSWSSRLTPYNRTRKKGDDEMPLYKRNIYSSSKPNYYGGSFGDFSRVSHFSARNQNFGEEVTDSWGGGVGRFDSLNYSGINRRKTQGMDVICE